MKCPNINLKDWKMFVKEVGEYDAYRIYIHNDYEIPTDYKVDTGWETIPNETIDNFKKISEVKESIRFKINKKIGDLERSTSENSKILLSDLKDIAKTIETASLNESLAKYTLSSKAYFQSIKNVIEKYSDKQDTMRLFHGFAGAFSDIPDAVEYLKEHNPEFHKENNLSELLELKEDLDRTYLPYAKRNLTETLSTKSTIMWNKAKEEYEREYNIANRLSEKKVNGLEAFNKKRDEVVNNRLIENKEKIERQERDYISSLLSTAPQDIDAWDAWLYDGRNINDQLFQISVTMLDEADYRAKDLFFDARHKIVEIRDSHTTKGDVHTDQRKIYDGIIEKIEGKETAYYVREAYSTFYEARAEYFKKIRKTDSIEEKEALINEFYDKYFIERPKKSSDYSKLKPEYINPQYKELERNGKQSLYNFLMKFNKESDSLVPIYQRLGARLPGMTVNITQKISDQGVWSAGKQALSDTFNIQKDDTNYGVYVDDQMQERSQVPVHFRGKIDIRDQSLDLLGMALANRYTSLQYNEKSKIKTDLEVLKDILAERDVYKTKNGRTIDSLIAYTNGTKEVDEAKTLSSKGDLSNVYKAYVSLLEDRLYGKSKIKDQILGLDGHKLASFLTSSSSNLLLIANVSSATVNALSGKVASWLYTSSNGVAKKENFLLAERKYIADLNNIAKDIGKEVPVSKTNLLLEKFMSNAGGFDAMAGNMMKDTRFKKLFSTQTLHGLNGSAEHMISSTLMYSLMKDISVKNKNGETVTIDEAYEVKGGKLQLIEGMRLLSNNKEIDHDIEFGIARKLKFIAEKTQGNYSETNRAMAQRYWWGTLGFHMRKWLLPGFQKRYAGISNAFTDVKDLEIHQKYFSESGQEFNEGTFTTSIRFARDIWNRTKREGNFIVAQSACWNELTDTERANVSQTMKEMMIRAIALSASVFLANLASDEDDEDARENLYASAYTLRRVYGEYALYYEGTVNGEIWSILKSPSATMSTVSKFFDAIGQFTQPFEVYKSGKKKDKSKLKEKLSNFIDPFPSNFSPDWEQKYNYATNN